MKIVQEKTPKKAQVCVKQFFYKAIFYNHCLSFCDHAMSLQQLYLYLKTNLILYLLVFN